MMSCYFSACCIASGEPVQVLIQKYKWPFLSFGNSLDPDWTRQELLIYTRGEQT